MEKLNYNISVKGRVQGVWFRKYTKEKADGLGLKGFVKNEPNGNVYIEAEGGKNELDAFINWLHDGPQLAKVSDVDYKIGEINDYYSFEINR